MNHIKLAIFLLCFPLASVPLIVNAKNVSISKAEKVGMSSERLQKLNALGERYVANGNYSGLVTLVARKGKIVHFKAHGNYGVDNDKRMEIDTLFRIYSMTKPITAIAAMMLYEEGTIPFPSIYRRLRTRRYWSMASWPRLRHRC